MKQLIASRLLLNLTMSIQISRLSCKIDKQSVLFMSVSCDAFQRYFNEDNIDLLGGLEYQINYLS